MLAWTDLSGILATTYDRNIAFEPEASDHLDGIDPIAELPPYGVRALRG